MTIAMRPIPLEAKSEDVRLLHQVLALLGHEAAREEVAAGRAGHDTVEKVRKLQAQLNVPIDESTLVDKRTAIAIDESLATRGLTAGSHSFIVTGVARWSSGGVKAKQQLIAFDVDLRGAGIYRLVKTISEVKKNGGFEFLNQTVSDSRGAYTFTFYDWQYRRAERKKADVVVFAVEGDEIIGRSEMVNAEGYSAQGLASNVDVFVSFRDKRTEYDILMGALLPFLKESETSFGAIAASADQITFAARELDLIEAHVSIAASAQLLIEGESQRNPGQQLSHELLYGIGRQDIALSWPVLYRKKEAELRNAILTSQKERIIYASSHKAIALFLHQLHEVSATYLLNEKNIGTGISLSEVLANALPEERLRVSFLRAWQSFKGANPVEFWTKFLPAHPDFRNRPELISALLLTQQLNFLTHNHQPLVRELQVIGRLESIKQLVSLEKSQWKKITKRTGLPESIPGDSEDERTENYIKIIQSQLNSAFPTERIAQLAAQNKLGLADNASSRNIQSFLAANEDFDFSGSRIHEFDKKIAAIAPNGAAELKRELMKVQRVFQISPTPEAMSVLLEKNLHSAYSIANIPEKNFIQNYAKDLGGESVAFAVHQRASFINTKVELAAMQMQEVVNATAPQLVLGSGDSTAALQAIAKHIPNYAELFGSPDFCECRECNSIYGAAPYLVELFRYLESGVLNADNKTPLDILSERRPDLVHLLLTCENTNTIIPYIDLGNEVMEYYAFKDSLTSFAGYDTGQATEQELRANAQNFNLETYRKIKDAKYPFTLPYHQPLDVIRTYSSSLGISRYEVMKAVNPNPSATVARAIAAEALGLGEEDYRILTGGTFAGVADGTQVHEYFGYTAATQLEGLSAVPEFLSRAGVRYPELSELVQTVFLNPYQSTLAFLQKFLTHASIDGPTLYTRFGQIKAGTLDPANDADIVNALNAQNAASGTNISTNDLATWVTGHFGEFQQVVTLFEPDSKCALDTTSLKTIKSIYEGQPTSGLAPAWWSKAHRFIRFWRKLGWTIQDTDLVLRGIGEDDIGAATIDKLEAVNALKTATQAPLNQLAVLWGNIDTASEQSLYQRLFLNKAVRTMEPAFAPDAWGGYLQDQTALLGDHKSAILAACRMSEEDLAAILATAQIIDGGVGRALNPATDILNLQNLSTIFRYVVLAKCLRTRISDLCKLIRLFKSTPFSSWDVQQAKFVNISPANTLEFFKLATAVRESSFNPPTLEYILVGTVSPDSSMGLKTESIQQTAKDIRAAFSAIEQEHPDKPELSLTSAGLAAQLSLTFQSQAVATLIAILEGTADFETKTDANLTVTIPDNLAAKYTYFNGTGRLTCKGVMTDQERTTLQGLTNASANFQSAVSSLYTAPENFIAENFQGVFANLAQANQILLDHPKQPSANTLVAKLEYIYQLFVPVLKDKLRRNVLARSISALVGLTEEATTLLIANDVPSLISNLSQAGYSADYFSDATWTASVLKRSDQEIDFSWGVAAPDGSVPADNFSVRWTAYLTAPASGAYTLILQTAATGEVVHLYLDGEELNLKKSSPNPTSPWEVAVELNAAHLHLLKAEYAVGVQLAGVQLSWKTTTAAPEIIPSVSTVPAVLVEAFTDQVKLYHRAAKFITGFGLSETEIRHFGSFAADFGGINFHGLTPDAWQRVANYTQLRKQSPQAQALLTDVFALANRVTPAPVVDDLAKEVLLATAWDKPDLDFLSKQHFGLGISDFKNEIWLKRIADVMKLVSRSGLAAETIASCGFPETDFDKLNTTALVLKNAVKAKYELTEWLSLASALNNKLRVHQRDALISYLLTRPQLQLAGVKDADDLFKYFLIDVQMGSCMDTSRIVQATASVQMFVNQCLMNLESQTVSGTEKGVAPEALDRGRWEVLSNFRLQQASRKVFLYPESYLEWRKDRSEFFQELESYLVQNDITEESVEQAFRNYLNSLNEVANLEVCGIHRENDVQGVRKNLHVFARTHNAPYKFFYRTWNQFDKWDYWKKVPIDIRCIEEGENSGVHLVPVVWKSRLIVFWPEFLTVQETRNTNQDQDIQQLSQNKSSSLQPVETWQVRLAWSEYRDSRWSPKQLSKEFLTYAPADGFRPRDLLLTVEINPDNNELRIASSDRTSSEKSLVLSDIQSPVKVGPELSAFWSGPPPTYRYKFGSRTTSGKLKLMDDTYLQQSTIHSVLPVDTMQGLAITLEDPFFFSDKERTYFVKPVPINVTERLKNPTASAPFTSYLGATNNGTTRARSLTAGTTPATTATAARSSVRLITEQTTAAETKIRASRIGNSFNSFLDQMDLGQMETRAATGLEFHTFYHPFSATYISNLNQGGLNRLLESDTSIASDEGAKFETTYDPNFTQGFVQQPADFPSRTYFKENVCFDRFGANSMFNMEVFFYAPLYIATKLSKNGKYRAAVQWFNRIFDPTTDAKPGPGETEVSRYWKVPLFKVTPAQSLEDWFKDNFTPTATSLAKTIIEEWRNDPFNPHIIASNRPLAFMKHVVIKYVENLIAWGDSLFRQDTRETVNEALRIYAHAHHILGPLPESIPKRGLIKPESYDSLRTKWDEFSNALVPLENAFPYSSSVSVADSTSGSNLLGTGSAFYFCIPGNEKLLDLWNTVSDRLTKIRTCKNIDGVERRLALFAPPIDPALLVQAAALGLSMGDILADLSSPPPIYRFAYLIQKANDFCADVRALGGSLLAALEKKDAEELNRLRTSHETQLLELVTRVRERQVLDARANKENLQKARETAGVRLQHYIELLGNDNIVVPPEPVLNATLSEDSQLPADTSIVRSIPDVDESLVDSEERGVKLIPREKAELDMSTAAMVFQELGLSMEGLAGTMNFIPNFSAQVEPFGLGVTVSYGGSNIAGGISGLAKVPQMAATGLSHEASLAARMASYIRREQEWTLQANLAAREIIQLDKQLVSADIRIQIAESELANHQKQLADALEVELYLKDKFSNQELYEWLKEQLFSVYKQSYNLAYDMARKAEKAYKYELGLETATFIQYGYWDSSKQGLVGGEKLQLALRQLEKSYLEQNRRELELTKNISLALLDPLALIELKETGKCYLSVPEELFDLDFRGHYFRRIKAASLSIPFVAGPYTSVSCTLRLLSNSIRVNTIVNGTYEHESDNGVWIDDDRFRTNHIPVTSIATSSGVNDSGMLEFNFNDARYLPFEGAGVISTWQLELATEKELRQFEYATISDVILHLRFYAQEDQGTFKEKATEHIKDFLANKANLDDEPLLRMFSLRHEFPSEWSRFFHPAVANVDQELEFTLGKERFPFFTQERQIIVSKIDVLARCSDPNAYEMRLSLRDKAAVATTSNPIPVSKSVRFGELKAARIGPTNNFGLNLANFDINNAVTLKLKRALAPDFRSLVTNPDEVKDLFFVVHYRLK